MAIVGGSRAVFAKAGISAVIAIGGEYIGADPTVYEGLSTGPNSSATAPAGSRSP
jgi:hypothetical protein